MGKTGRGWCNECLQVGWHSLGSSGIGGGGSGGTGGRGRGKRGTSGG